MVVVVVAVAVVLRLAKHSDVPFSIEDWICDLIKCGCINDSQ